MSLAERAATTTGRRALERCDPSVLLAVVVLVPLVLLRVRDPRPLVVLWVAAVVGVLWTTRISVRALAWAHLPFAGFGLSLLTVNAVTRGGDALAEVGPLEVTDDGLRVGAALAVRSLVVGVGAVGLLAAVEPARLLTSLRLVARLPVRPTYAMLAAYRLLDDLPAEWLAVRRAHAVRMPARDGRRRLQRTPRAFGRVAFALLVTSIRRAERVAVALESRGLGAVGRDGRTTWREARPGRPDVVLIAVVAAALAGVLGAAS